MTIIVVLDDWQRVARDVADWSSLRRRADVVFIEEPFASDDAAAAALRDADIVVAMRERTAFPASLIARLPRLRMIALTGGFSNLLDFGACAARGIVVSNTGGDRSGAATAEMTLALLLAAARQVPAGDRSMRAGGFQVGIASGTLLEGRTLGIVGLGRIGSRVARLCGAFGMTVLAWSQNLTADKAEAAGARLVDKATLFREADAVSLHLFLSDRSRDIVGEPELALLKPGAILVNTARAGLVAEQPLLARLRQGTLTAALDVYWHEPLAVDHPLRALPNVVLSPHLGYCTGEVYSQFYRESIENVNAFLDGSPIRVLNPAAPVAPAAKPQP